MESVVWTGLRAVSRKGYVARMELKNRGEWAVQTLANKEEEN